MAVVEATPQDLELLRDQVAQVLFRPMYGGSTLVANGLGELVQVSLPGYDTNLAIGDRISQLSDQVYTVPGVVHDPGATYRYWSYADETWLFEELVTGWNPVTGALIVELPSATEPGAEDESWASVAETIDTKTTQGRQRLFELEATFLHDFNLDGEVSDLVGSSLGRGFYLGQLGGLFYSQSSLQLQVGAPFQQATLVSADAAVVSQITTALSSIGNASVLQLSLYNKEGSGFVLALPQLLNGQLASLILLPLLADYGQGMGESQPLPRPLTLDNGPIVVKDPSELAWAEQVMAADLDGNGRVGIDPALLQQLPGTGADDLGLRLSPDGKSLWLQIKHTITDASQPDVVETVLVSSDPAVVERLRTAWTNLNSTGRANLASATADSWLGSINLILPEFSSVAPGGFKGLLQFDLQRPGSGLNQWPQSPLQVISDPLEVLRLESSEHKDFNADTVIGDRVSSVLWTGLAAGDQADQNPVMLSFVVGQVTGWTFLQQIRSYDPAGQPTLPTSPKVGDSIDLDPYETMAWPSDQPDLVRLLGLLKSNPGSLSQPIRRAAFSEPLPGGPARAGELIEYGEYDDYGSGYWYSYGYLVLEPDGNQVITISNDYDPETEAFVPSVLRQATKELEGYLDVDLNGDGAGGASGDGPQVVILAELGSGLYLVASSNGDAVGVVLSPEPLLIGEHLSQQQLDQLQGFKPDSSSPLHAWLQTLAADIRNGVIPALLSGYSLPADVDASGHVAEPPKGQEDHNGMILYRPYHQSKPGGEDEADAELVKLERVTFSFQNLGQFDSTLITDTTQIKMVEKQLSEDLNLDGTVGPTSLLETLASPVFVCPSLVVGTAATQRGLYFESPDNTYLLSTSAAVVAAAEAVAPLIEKDVVTNPGSLPSLVTVAFEPTGVPVEGGYILSLPIYNVDRTALIRVDRYTFNVNDEVIALKPGATILASNAVAIRDLEAEIDFDANRNGIIGITVKQLVSGVDGPQVVIASDNSLYVVLAGGLREPDAATDPAVPVPGSTIPTTSAGTLMVSNAAALVAAATEVAALLKSDVSNGVVSENGSPSLLRAVLGADGVETGEYRLAMPTYTKSGSGANVKYVLSKLDEYALTPDASTGALKLKSATAVTTQATSTASILAAELAYNVDFNRSGSYGNAVKTLVSGVEGPQVVIGDDNGLYVVMEGGLSGPDQSDPAVPVVGSTIPSTAVFVSNAAALVAAATEVAALLKSDVSNGVVSENGSPSLLRAVLGADGVETGEYRLAMPTYTKSGSGANVKYVLSKLDEYTLTPDASTGALKLKSATAVTTQATSTASILVAELAYNVDFNRSGSYGNAVKTLVSGVEGPQVVIGDDNGLYVVMEGGLSGPDQSDPAVPVVGSTIPSTAVFVSNAAALVAAATEVAALLKSDVSNGVVSENGSPSLLRAVLGADGVETGEYRLAMPTYTKSGSGANVKYVLSKLDEYALTPDASTGALKLKSATAVTTQATSTASILVAELAYNVDFNRSGSYGNAVKTLVSGVEGPQVVIGDDNGLYVVMEGGLSGPDQSDPAVPVVGSTIPSTAVFVSNAAALVAAATEVAALLKSDVSNGVVSENGSPSLLRAVLGADGVETGEYRLAMPTYTKSGSGANVKYVLSKLDEYALTPDASTGALKLKSATAVTTQATSTASILAAELAYNVDFNRSGSYGNAVKTLVSGVEGPQVVIGDDNGLYVVMEGGLSGPDQSDPAVPVVGSTIPSTAVFVSNAAALVAAATEVAALLKSDVSNGVVSENGSPSLLRAVLGADGVETGEYRLAMPTYTKSGSGANVKYVLSKLDEYALTPDASTGALKLKSATAVTTQATSTASILAAEYGYGFDFVRDGVIGLAVKSNLGGGLYVASSGSVYFSVSSTEVPAPDPRDPSIKGGAIPEDAILLPATVTATATAFDTALKASVGFNGLADYSPSAQGYPELPGLMRREVLGSNGEPSGVVELAVGSYAKTGSKTATKYALTGVTVLTVDTNAGSKTPAVVKSVKTADLSTLLSVERQFGADFNLDGATGDSVQTALGGGLFIAKSKAVYFSLETLDASADDPIPEDAILLPATVTATATAFDAALKASVGFNGLADYSPSAQGYPELPGLVRREVLRSDGEPSGVVELAVGSYAKTGSKAATKYALTGVTVLTVDTNAGSKTPAVVKSVKTADLSTLLSVERQFRTDFNLDGATGDSVQTALGGGLFIAKSKAVYFSLETQDAGVDDPIPDDGMLLPATVTATATAFDTALKANVGFNGLANYSPSAQGYPELPGLVRREVLRSDGEPSGVVELAVGSYAKTGSKAATKYALTGVTVLTVDTNAGSKTPAVVKSVKTADLSTLLSVERQFGADFNLDGATGDSVQTALGGGLFIAKSKAVYFSLETLDASADDPIPEDAILLPATVTATATAFDAALKASVGFNGLADYSPSAQGYPELPGLVRREVLRSDGEPSGVVELAVGSYAKTGSKAATKYALTGVTVLTVDTNAGSKTPAVVKSVKTADLSTLLSVERQFRTDFNLDGATGDSVQTALGGGLFIAKSKAVYFSLETQDAGVDDPIPDDGMLLPATVTATATAFDAALKASVGFNGLADYSPSAQGYPELPGLMRREVLGSNGDPSGVVELAVGSYAKTGSKAATKYALTGVTVLTVDTNAGSKTPAVVKSVKAATADLYLNEFIFEVDFDLNGQTGPLGMAASAVELGSSDADVLNPTEGQLALGLQGADTLTAGALPTSAGALPAVLLGGADGDTYNSVDGTFALIVDTGTSGVDKLVISWLDLSRTAAQLKTDGITGTVIDGMALRIQRTVGGVATDGVIISGYSAAKKTSPIEQIVDANGTSYAFADAVNKLGTLAPARTFLQEYGLAKTVVDNSLAALGTIEKGYAAVAQPLV